MPWAGAVLALVVVGLVATVVAHTAWPLVAAVLVVTTSVHAGRAGWRMAFFLTLLAALVLQVSWAWFTPHLGGSMATDDTVAWTVAGLAAVPFALVTGAPSLSRRQVVDAVAVLVVPVGVLTYLAVTAATRYYDWLGWAMEGDSANNMLLVRAMVDEGGLLRSQGNNAPLSTVIYAAWGAPGLAGADAAGTVRHLVLNGGQLTLLIGCLLSVLGSLLVLRVSPPSLATRVAAAVTVGLLPWLWCVMGYSFRQGFQNAAPAMAVLLLAWSCWEVQRRHPVASLTGMILATWATAAVWGPVLLIPAVWVLAVAVRQRRALLASRWDLALPGAALLGAGTYAVLVTLRDLTATGGVPGVDGGHPNYDQRWALGVGIGLLVLSVVCFRRLPRETTWGYWLAVPGIAFGVLQLVRARQAAELPAWGYYPIKFTWIVMASGLIILFAVVWPVLHRLAARWWGGNGVLLAFAVCAGLMFWTTPPVRPATLGYVFTPVTLHDATGLDRYYARMFELMEEDPRTIVSSYGQPPTPQANDGAMNFWLLQSGSKDINDPLRFSAYTMDSTDPAALCSAITVWGGDVRVVTRDPGLEKKLEKACPDQEFTVDLAGR